MNRRNTFIRTRFDLCSGCGLCQLACSFQLLGGYNPHRALIRITHKSENLYHFPIVCSQCQNPYCANICPVKAIDRHPETGAMIVDHNKCIGCGLCAQYCPTGMVTIDPEIKKSVKCDLCNGNPACVITCPTGALEIAFTDSPKESDNE